MKRLFSLFLVFCLCLPFVFGTGLFGFLENERQIYWPTDLNGEDVNFHFLWVDEAWITFLHATDVNVTDLNVVGDINATGSIEADGCIISDCFSSASDRDRFIDASGPTWDFVDFGIDVDGDIDGFDIVAENDLSCGNDLEVGDNADILGDLNVVGATGLMGCWWWCYFF